MSLREGMLVLSVLALVGCDDGTDAPPQPFLLGEDAGTDARDAASTTQDGANDGG